MDLSASPLVIPKIRIPAAREGWIHRDRLLDLLHSSVEKSLILVCAPAGYGKTTLLASWAQSLLKQGTAVSWYAIDPSDNDIVPFRAYLVAGILDALGSNSELAHLAQLLRTSPELETKHVLNTIINAVLSCGRKCELLFDDYHLISTPEIHDVLLYLLDHLPENLRIVISSREDPPFPLARMRARGQLQEIHLNDLRFSEEEAGCFLNDLMKLNLSSGSIRELEDRTEGWVTGLQLAALALSGSAGKEEMVATFSGSHRYLAEYMLEEVIDSQPEAVRIFLLTTSILDRLYAPLCDALQLEEERSENESREGKSDLLISKSQAILETLEKANLFLVPVDEERIWFRYHHLFRDFLIARLEKEFPGRAADLHRKACTWLAGHSHIRDAAEHAFQTGDWEFAASFVEEHSFTLITQSDLSTIYEWCSEFPEEVMQKHPLLCLQQALALSFNFRRQNLPRIENRLKQADQAILALGDQELAGVLSDLASIVRTFVAFTPDPQADPNELLVVADSMVKSSPEDNAGRYSALLMKSYALMALQNSDAAIQTLENARQIAIHFRLYFGVVEATFHLAQLALNQGKLQQAEEICRQGKMEVISMLPPQEKDLPALGSLDIALGCAMLEQNELEKAEKNILDGLRTMGGGTNPYALMTAYLALFRLKAWQNKSAEALNYLNDLEAIWPDISFLTAGLKVNQQLLKNPKSPALIEKSKTWCERFSASIPKDAECPGVGPYGGAEIYYQAWLTWIKIEIVLGNVSKTKPQMEQLYRKASANHLNHRMIELSLLEAAGAHFENKSFQTTSVLINILQLAKTAGELFVFSQYPEIFGALKKIAQQGRYTEFIEQILAQEPGNQPQTNLGFFGQTLSERELEVLQLIAKGATNQEIAEQLVITVGTVKSHINHLLAKLDSHNRTEAVAKARQLGLLES